MSVLSALRQATHRPASLVWEQISAVPMRVRAAIFPAPRAESRTSERSVPSLQDRRDDLIAFYDHFEDLVGILCDAAQYGPESSLETRYSKARDWLLRNYSGLRHFVVGYLEPDDCDAGFAARHADRVGDAFEALFNPPTLELFLRGDDGHMISRIVRTRQALTLYGEHLRQLSA